MEVTDFTYQDGRSSLQATRRVLAKAVTETYGSSTKEAWLDNVLLKALENVTGRVSFSLSDTVSDTASNNSAPGLKVALVSAVDRSSIYQGTFRDQLTQDLIDARTELAS